MSQPGLWGETMADVTQGHHKNTESAPSDNGIEPAQVGVVYCCGADNQRTVGIKHARQALASDECVVIPTDTVYGIAVNAFSPQAVEHLLKAKGRNRTMPPPVLIAHAGLLDGLAEHVSDQVRSLAQAFWPGGLTLICHAQPSVQWDLGDTQGTVALRVPDDDIAREVLTESGPLAVSSANKTGLPAATTVEQAREMLQDKVSVYLDGGDRRRSEVGGADSGVIAEASTIVDCTGDVPRIVRQGVITEDQLRAVVPEVLGLGQDDSADLSTHQQHQGDSGAQAATGSVALSSVDSGADVSGVVNAQQSQEVFDQDRRRPAVSTTTSQSYSVDRVVATTLVDHGGAADAGAQGQHPVDQDRHRR